jgi:hypothetical protein
VRVSLDELPDGEAICGFSRGNGDVFAHERELITRAAEIERRLVRIRSSASA